MIKRIRSSLTVSFFFIPIVSYNTIAQDMNLNIMQELTEDETIEANREVENIWSEP